MDDCIEMFELVKEYCKGQMPASPYSLWIKDLSCKSLTHESATLAVKSDLIKDIIETRYMDLLETSFREVMGFPVEVLIAKIENRDAAAFERKEAEQPEPKPGVTAGGEYDYTFETFIVGSSNKFAHAASLAVATNPAAAYNPLFIYGGSGLGKTHLLCAICNEISRTRPGYNILYVKSEDFTNELISAVRTNSTASFREKYRQADVLLMDDVQFIGGKESTQEEFFHTFNTLYLAGKQIVLTSDRPPKEIKTLEERIRGRFESGLLADVQAPDYETRVAIVRRKAELLSIELSDDVIEYIANRLKTNIRQLEGTVKKIKAYKQLAKVSPSVSIAQNAIRDILNDSQPVSVTIERVIGEVSRYCEVSAQDIRSSKHSAQVSRARQMAMYIIRNVTQMSMAAIGEEFGGRDHSTVVYAVNKIEKTMTTNHHLKNTVEDIIKNVKSS
jgi:chromosomal replication initiator protein